MLPNKGLRVIRDNFMEQPQNPQPYLEIILAYLLGQPLPPAMQAKLLSNPEAQAVLLQLARLIAHLDDPTWLEEVAAVSEGIPSETVAAFLEQREALRLLGPQAIARLEMLCTPPPSHFSQSLRPAYPTFTQRWNAAQRTRPMAPDPSRPPVPRGSRVRVVWALMAASMLLVVFMGVFMAGLLSTAWVLSTNQLVRLELSTPTPTQPILRPTVALPTVLATPSPTPQTIAIVPSPTGAPLPTDTPVPPSPTTQRFGVIQALPTATPTPQAPQPVAQLPTHTPTTPPTVAPSPTQPLPSPTQPFPTATPTHTPAPPPDDDDDDDEQAPMFGVPPTPTIVPGEVPSRIDVPRTEPLLTPMENPVRQIAPELEPVAETSSVAVLESTSPQVVTPLTVGVWHPETNQLDMDAAAVTEPDMDAILVFDLSALTTIRTAALHLAPISGTVEALDVWLHPTETLSPTQVLTAGHRLPATESLQFDISPLIVENHSQMVVIRVRSTSPVEWVGEIIVTGE